MASKTLAASASAQTSVQDDLIMGTNNSSIVSKRSVERLYFTSEAQFYRFFVKKFRPRSPLINRGYWLRLRAIDTILRRFLAEASLFSKKVVVNLGCGSDVLPWRYFARHGPSSRILFVDVDYPPLMLAKRSVILETPQLRSILGDDFHVSISNLDPVLLRSENYCQIGCDLRELGTFREALQTLLPQSDCKVLFVAEVSLAYMNAEAVDALLHWAGSVSNSDFCLLEQILPQGPEHPFAKTMLGHFEKLGTPLKSVPQNANVESQRARLLAHGWRFVDVWDLWEAWSSDAFVSCAERASLDKIEPFDEWEELVLFARHYFVAHASTSATNWNRLGDETPPQADTISNKFDLRVACLLNQAPKRRFADAVLLPDATGTTFVVNMMGMGNKGRADSYDVFKINGQGSLPLQSPVTGPQPRVCYTLTELGEFGVLLAGGRRSPTSALSDCWLFRKGSDCSWRPTWALPNPIFRHAAIRLAGSSLALLVGGKTGASTISDSCYVFHPVRGWLQCETRGYFRRPTFGAVLCSSLGFDNSAGIFRGLLAGGIDESGRIVNDCSFWSLDINSDRPIIEFQLLVSGCEPWTSLSLFGARCVDVGFGTIVCGGVGGEPSMLGHQAFAVVRSNGGSYTVSSLKTSAGYRDMPFMIGSSVLSVKEGVVAVLGGGATCFSMGTFWESGVYVFVVNPGTLRFPHADIPMNMDYVKTVKVVRDSQINPSLGRDHVGRTTVTPIPRIRLTSDSDFGKVLRDGRPVILEGLELGDCTQKWSAEYLKERVGEETEVVVHVCEEDTEKMDFISKNFRYVTDTFGRTIDKVQAGERLYLRSLSRERPLEQPAMLEHDFPGLARDFCLPVELGYVQEHTFSSVFRMSGMVKMWLHYDVMANVYAQVIGRRRMVLFPPGDVAHLCLAPGASSSSLDVFSLLEGPRLLETQPHEAMLQPGDVLFLPALWLHTAAPVTEMSVAVNVFFRDLDSGYSTGRDVYGNRDLAAYEKGRQDAGRIIRSLERLPADRRRFYLSRIASELQQAAESS